MFCLIFSSFSYSQISFVPEKYGSIINPVFSFILGSIPEDFNLSQMAMDLLQFHTTAWYNGFPSRSQMIKVSRWLEIPQVRMFLTSKFFCLKDARQSFTA